jgi:copper(I)-binding protein
MRKIILFLVICVGLPFLLLKCMGTAQSKESITVSNAFANPTMGDLKVGAVFFDIQNKGTIPDAVVAVETPIAARAELHEHTHENGVMRMRQVNAVELAPGQLVKFEPGDLHVMLFDLKKPLKLHERFPLILKTRVGLKMTVMVKVEDRD